VGPDACGDGNRPRGRGVRFCMRRWIPALLVPLTLAVTSESHALAPGDAARGFREGANHHAGDDGFAAVYGRLPGPDDAEGLRMHTHFAHVREWLRDRPPTRPELAARRQAILGYFDEYIARGTTPLNVHVPWRTPVFIDDRGTICAVGYLIERTAGRALAERIARDHRYNVLEDIAAAMPEVGAWVESSGLSLEELASIQPGYIPPDIWSERDLVDGPIDETPIGLETTETSGTWTSRYPNGQRLAEGHFVDKRPQGGWRFFHPSGNLAAIGSFAGGVRDGRWTFFHDNRQQARMATGSFLGGTLVDGWRHFDESGRLIGRSRPASPVSFGGAGYLVHVMAGQEAGRHWVHRADIAGMKHRLDFLADGTEQIYVKDGDEHEAYDKGGHKVSRVDGKWISSDCHWNRMQRMAATAGDVVTVHGLMLERPGTCDAGAAVSASRGKHLDAMMTTMGHGGLVGIPEEVSASLASFVVKPSVDAARPAAGVASEAATLATQ